MPMIMIQKTYQNNQNHWKFIINQIGSLKSQRRMLMIMTLKMFQNNQNLWMSITNQLGSYKRISITRTIVMTFLMIHLLTRT
jgi:hypothetical protein